MARGRSSSRRSGSRGRHVHRNAGNGRFTSKASARRRPSRTTQERVGSGTSNRRTVYRSASTGRFVTKAHANRSPGTTIAQRV